MRRPDSLKVFAFWQIPCSIRPVTRVAWIVIIALLIAGATRAGFADFAVYWRAGQQALAGQSVYLEPGHFQFKYSPAVAAILGALTQLTHRSFLFLGLPSGSVLEPYSNPIVVTGAIRATALTLYFAYAFLWIQWARRLAGDYAPWTLLFLAVPWIEELSLGQLNILPLWLMSCVILDLDQSRSSIHGTLRLSAAFALAVQLKLYALIAVPLLVFRRKWALLAGTAAMIVLMNWLLPSASNSLAFAQSEFSAWIRTLSTSTGQLLESRFNLSLLGFALKVSHSHGIAKALWIAGVSSFVGLLWTMRHRSAQTTLSLLIAGIVILNPLAWSYWTVFLVPLLPSLFICLTRPHPMGRLQLFALLLFLGFSALRVRWVQDWLHAPLVLLLFAHWLFTTGIARRESRG